MGIGSQQDRGRKQRCLPLRILQTCTLRFLFHLHSDKLFQHRTRCMTTSHPRSKVRYHNPRLLTHLNCRLYLLGTLCMLKNPEASRILQHKKFQQAVWNLSRSYQQGTGCIEWHQLLSRSPKRNSLCQSFLLLGMRFLPHRSCSSEHHLLSTLRQHMQLGVH